MTMQTIKPMQIRKGTIEDLDEIVNLYNDLIDQLERKNSNYPGWKKDVYPARQDAEKGINDGELYVAVEDNKIAGTIILSHEPENGYENVKWLAPSNYDEIYVIRTLAVHPLFLKKGVGKILMDFAEEEGRKNNMKSIRLDVVDKNIPAERLYEKCGYKYLDTVDLGYGEYGLPWYKIYEKVLVE